MFVSFEISSKNVYTSSNFLMACLLTCKTLIKTLIIDCEHELKSYNSIRTLNLASLLHAVGRLDLPANMLVAYSILLPFASNRSAQTFLRVVLRPKRIRLAGETYTFGRRNVYVCQAKRVRLAGETCTFGRRNMHSYTCKLISLDR